MLWMKLHWFLQDIRWIVLRQKVPWFKLQYTTLFSKDKEIKAITIRIVLTKNAWLRFYWNQRKAKICFITSLTFDFFDFFNVFCINHKLHWDFHIACHYLWNTYKRYVFFLYVFHNFWIEMHIHHCSFL